MEPFVDGHRGPVEVGHKSMFEEVLAVVTVEMDDA